jgi:MFS family permease
VKTKLSDVRLASLSIISVCVLAFEIQIMRVFAVTSWSNFGSMVISIALLGFSAAGVLLTAFRKRVRENPDGWLTGPAFALGPAMAAAHVLAQRVPFNPVLIASDASQLRCLAAYYLVYSVPFFVAGIFMGAIFSALASRLHQVYFWNMLGSGLGGLLVLGLMYVFPPELMIYPLVCLAFVPALLASLRWLAVEGRLKARAMEVVFSFILFAMSFLLLALFGGLNVSDFKPISYARKFPDVKQVYSSFSPRGEMRVFSSSYFHFAPGLSDNAGISLSQMPKNAFLGLYTDGDGPVGIMRKLMPQEERYIDFLPMSVPYLSLSRPKVLLLRLGGGAGVHIALHHGAREVKVVESNPDVIHMLRDVPFFKEYTGGILQDGRVKIENEEVRAFAGSTREKFDLVEIGLIDSFGLSQAGGYSVEENYTYTVEAIREYLGCLTPSGILSITVWDRLDPPRNVPKLLSTVVEAMRRGGSPHPERRIFSFNLLLSTATVLVKNSEFQLGEIDRLNEYCGKMSFDVNYYPGMPEREKNFELILKGYDDVYGGAGQAVSRPVGGAEADLNPADFYHFCLEWMFGGKSRELFSRYIFDIRPATDDRPYYSGYIKPRTLPRFLPQLGGISEEWGHILLLATFLQSIAFGAIIILFPVLLGKLGGARERKEIRSILLYFGCLGLGYMMMEIFLIQRFTFVLADPVVTNATVLTVLLVSSGFGSLVSARMRVKRKTAVRAAAAGICLYALFSLLALPSVLRAFLGAPAFSKAVLTSLLIAPIGFLLGIPFPAGLSVLSESRKDILPWAWGINGALSVVGSILTRVISTSAGFGFSLGLTALLYLTAGLAYARVEAEKKTGMNASRDSRARDYAFENRPSTAAGMNDRRRSVG